ncbi:GntR family transcriptional regulator [Aestuariispira ectoiniformans]|uniref:GntR family transcriptional regulator n=1 Tax=Aestuariispira ectoiniformans TaxID=2775080 RepID=UPI00223BBB4F|nr:GntR family transcriptional regulator [Aestuariispira ectoiniformans]
MRVYSVTRQQKPKKEKLADRAYRQLEEMIVTLRLPPGDVLNEASLCEKLDIGRTPVREALQRLATERLVLIRPRRAMTVSPVDAQEHLLVLETRAVLEHLITGLAAERADAQARRALQDCAQAFATAAADKDIDGFMRLDREFDQILGEACGNPFARECCTPLQSKSRRFWYCHQGVGELAYAADMHRRIMAGVISGDPVEAQEASDALMAYLVAATRRVLSEQDGSGMAVLEGQA